MFLSSSLVSYNDTINIIDTANEGMLRETEKRTINFKNRVGERHLNVCEMCTGEKTRLWQGPLCAGPRTTSF